MTTINRTIETEHDRTMAARLIEARAVPFTFTLTDGKHRTTAQNKLQRLWMNEIAEQKGDTTPEEVRAYCKLTIGVPILRAQNEAFRIRYDEVVKPLPYVQKIAIMSEPLDLPVTRLMTTKQKTEYLDGIIRHFAEQGIVLTMPEEPSEVVAPSSDAGSGEAAEAGGIEAADNQSAPPASEGISALTRMILEECVDNMLRDAFSEPAIERLAKVDKLKATFLALPELAGHERFVETCAETARRIIGKPAEKARARDYLMGRMPA